MLPNEEWLRMHGYSGLASAMRRRPELFIHIPKGWASRSRRRSPEDWVPIAEKLAKNSNGLLPNTLSLRNSGHAAMQRAVHSHPTLFAHIPRQRPNRTLAEWVPIIESLARRHGGTLPNQGWLEARGFSRVRDVMRRHPVLFGHIKREVQKGRSVNEWLPIAEQLAKDHHGLPNAKWLNDNGYTGLYTMLRKFPRSFKHIHRHRLRTNGQPA